MIEFKKTFEIEPSLMITIKRVLNNENNFQSFKLIPIQNSAFFHFGTKITSNPLILPKLYSALTCLTGASDNRYDDYKGSYSFTFELMVDKNSNFSQYCYHIYHYRSYIEFSVYDMTSKSDQRESRYYHQPNDTLFSDKDICRFSNYFCNYALGYIEGIKYKPKPFIKYSDSNLLLFGYLTDEYFVNDYDDQEKYLNQREVLQNQLDADV